MVLKSRFFNSVSGDRKYSAEDWADYFNAFLTSGYIYDPTGLRVSTSSGMTIRVRPGVAMVNGYMMENDADYNLTLDAASEVAPRIDRVVVRWQKIGRTITLDVLKGSPSSNPEPPSLTRNDNIYELGIADITVRRDTSSILAIDIRDTRNNNDLCGRVVGRVSQITSEEFESQYTAMFDVWFNEIKGQLDDDTAGMLSNQLDAAVEQMNQVDTKVTDLTSSLNSYRTDVPNTYTNLTLQGTITRYDSTYTPRVTKVGKMVNVQGAVQGITSANTVVAILPAGFRPPRDLYWMDVTSNVSGMSRTARWRLRTNGELIMQATVDGKYNVLSPTFWYFDKSFFI